MSDDFVWSAGGLEVSGLHDYAAQSGSVDQTLGLRIENLTPGAKRDLCDLIAAGYTIRIVVEPKPFVPGFYRPSPPNPTGIPRGASWYRTPPWEHNTVFSKPFQWEEVEVTVK